MSLLSTLSFALLCHVACSVSLHGSQTLLSTYDMSISIAINPTSDEVKLSFTGPSDRWFAVGFGATTMSGTYTIYHTESEACLERLLGNRAPGSQLSSTTTVASDSTDDDGVRTVVCTRSISASGDYFSFADIAADTTLNLIYARGSSSSFSSHLSRGDTTITFSNLNIIAFSKTLVYRHASIPDALALLDHIAAENGWNILKTEDSSVFDDVELLDETQVIIFVSTSGDVLDASQEANFENWFTSKPGGFVGLHAASATEFDWEFYGEMVGAYFGSHPAIQDGTVTYKNPARAGRFKNSNITWRYADEWYDYRNNKNPADQDDGNMLILGTVDEDSYSGATMDAAIHPIMWAHHYRGGRSWYTAQGHASEFYDLNDATYENVAGIIENAIKWASFEIEDENLLEELLGPVPTFMPTSAPSTPSPATQIISSPTMATDEVGVVATEPEATEDNNNDEQTGEDTEGCVTSSNDLLLWAAIGLAVIMILEWVLMACFCVKNKKEDGKQSEVMAGVITHTTHDVTRTTPPTTY